MTTAVKELKCRECQGSSPTWYWFNLKGAKMNQPLCEDCYRRKVLTNSDDEESAEVWICGKRQKVRGRSVGGVFVYWEED